MNSKHTQSNNQKPLMNSTADDLENENNNKKEVSNDEVCIKQLQS